MTIETIIISIIDTIIVMIIASLVANRAIEKRDRKLVKSLLNHCKESENTEEEIKGNNINDNMHIFGNVIKINTILDVVSCIMSKYIKDEDK